MPEEKDKSKIKVEIVKEETPNIEKQETTNQELKEELYFTEEKASEEDKVKEEKVKSQDKPQNKEKEKVPFFILFLVFLFGLVIGAGLIGGIFYYKMKMEGISKKVSVKEPPKIEEKREETTPTPTVKELSLGDFKVLILNGSGIKGEAKRVEDLIKKIGFDKTEIGNANSYDYTDTVVYLKDNVEDSVYEKLEKTLPELSFKKASLEKESPYDIKIIIGKTRR